MNESLYITNSNFAIRVYIYIMGFGTKGWI